MTQIRKGALEAAVLAVLAKAAATSGEIRAVLAAHQALAISRGTIYPLLGRLERLGWLDFSWRQATRGRPQKVYRLSPAGRAALKALAADLRLLNAALLELLPVR